MAHDFHILVANCREQGSRTSLTLSFVAGEHTSEPYAKGVKLRPREKFPCQPFPHPELSASVRSRSRLVPCSKLKSSIQCSSWLGPCLNFIYAIQRPSGDQTGEANPPSGNDISLRSLAPSARINQISCPASANSAPLRNTICEPSGKNRSRPAFVAQLPRVATQDG